MKNKALVLFMVVLAGCVPSWNPFYTEQDLVFDPALVGAWRAMEAKDSSKEAWEFTKTGNKHYQLAQTDEGGKAAFEVRFPLQRQGAVNLRQILCSETQPRSL